MNRQIVIRHDNGTYFVGHTAIGPRFGGTLRQAKRFPSPIAAAKDSRHWAFGETEQETIDHA